MKPSNFGLDTPARYIESMCRAGVSSPTFESFKTLGANPPDPCWEMIFVKTFAPKFVFFTVRSLNGGHFLSKKLNPNVTYHLAALGVYNSTSRLH